ncbi:6-carboxytetrahydropterin synthase [Planctomycetota bacterium]|nr:6-carboxytetrahydropterin synthase [Planctomycetota bacterium]
MDRVIIRHQYEFSAAHRLHCADLSDEQNIKIFGKCNNPEGHGHNYVLEVAISLPVDPMGEIATVEELDELIDTTVIKPFDHKHLNKDTPEFADLNPTVENISKVIYEKLAPKVDDLGSMPGSELVEIKLWETQKTACTYKG